MVFNITLSLFIYAEVHFKVEHIIIVSWFIAFQGSLSLFRIAAQTTQRADFPLVGMWPCSGLSLLSSKLLGWPSTRYLELNISTILAATSKQKERSSLFLWPLCECWSGKAKPSRTYAFSKKVSKASFPPLHRSSPYVIVADNWSPLPTPLMYCW